MGKPYKRGKIWWIHYSVNGKTERESTHTTSKMKAEAVLREREQAIWEGRFIAAAKKSKDKTLQELYDLWIEVKAKKASLRSDKARLKRALEFFGKHRLLSTIEPEDVIRWKAKIATMKNKAGEPFSTATVNRHLAALGGVVNLAKELGYANQDPMRGVSLDPENNERNRICSPEEYDVLCKIDDLDMRLFLIIGYWLGMREGEIAGIKRTQIKQGLFWLGSGDTKEAARKTVPIPIDALPIIDALPRHSHGRLFKYTANTYCRRFRALFDELGMTDLRFHDLRHTAVTNMIDAGIDILTIQSITGHKTLHMTKRYSHISNRRRQAAVTQVQEMFRAMAETLRNAAPQSPEPAHTDQTS